MIRASTFLVAAFLSTSAAMSAETWLSYSNARFGYHIDVPPRFTVALPEPANGDGRTFQTVDKADTLYIWGGYNVAGDDFEGEVAWRIEQTEQDGWSVTYRRQTTNWASWSGTQGNRIFYERAIKICDNASAYFLVVYGKGQKVAFDSIISRLVKSLHGDDCSKR